MHLFREPPRDIKDDPDYYYMVGQLTGVTLMMSRYMALHSDEKGKGMAAQADKVLNFFLEKGQRDDLGGWDHTK